MMTEIGKLINVVVEIEKIINTVVIEIEKYKDNCNRNNKDNKNRNYEYY